MKIAIVAATDRETEPVRNYLAERIHLKERHHFMVWTTGVGLMHTTYAMIRHLRSERPDLVVQTGICGGFHPLEHPIGSAVAIREEVLGDTGVMEADGNWRDIHDMKLADPDGFPYQEKLLRNPHDALLKASRLPAVRAVSVNCVTTDKLMIRRLSDTYSPDVESMEGAAFHYVCLQEGVPFLQLRGISNLIGDRDKDRWQMQQALENVQAALIRFLNNLAEPGLI